MSKYCDSCRVRKMSAKLIVHKFETGINYKYLEINIDDSSETKVSEWLDGKSFQKKKDNVKSPRLVVKIVSGEEINKFNLDSCAKLVNTLDINAYQLFHKGDNINYYERDQKCNKVFIDQTLNNNYNEYNKKLPSEHFYLGNNVFNLPNNPNILSLNTVCPLEYSLEKVKENNARIMENIQMLNRTLNFTKKKEIMQTVLPKSFPCEVCEKCFVYETGLKRHYTMRHSMIESQPGWQIVWTCIECFQVWPQYQIALEHSKQCCSAENTPGVWEIKTSSLLQCEFCEKVFTSIPRLLRHSKTHTTKNNYECNSCNRKFTSYKSAEEHWLSCLWLSTHYNFSMPKFMLCNACDKKFRNYEQLYNHRYKIGHFLAKINDNHLGVYNYQCEICSDSYPSTSELLVHRGKCHSRHDNSSYTIIQDFKDFEDKYKTTENNIVDDIIDNI